MDEWTQKIDDLINEFPDDRYIELLEEMCDRANNAAEARREDEARERRKQEEES